jgi:hypothetical protein
MSMTRCTVAAGNGGLPGLRVLSRSSPSTPSTRAAALVSRCITEQTAAELSKGSTPAQFEIVLRDKCRVQEERFKKTLLARLKKEGSLNSQAVRAVNELLAAFRQRAVTDYGDTMRLPERRVNRIIGI